MRFSRVGQGASGRSTIVETREFDPPELARANGVGVHHLWKTTQMPVELPNPPLPIDPRWLDIAVAPEATNWLIFSLAPGRSVPSHFTSTLDYDIVLSGEVTLVLQDGELRMSPGDSVLVPGLVHHWLAGPDGCALSVVTIGFAAPGSAG
ncbi:MAG: hypothetical protein JWQ97_2450, partial [Phenylobacterium sp.]|nr:hypothetical protein [Phenylobacterium sp.]